MGNSNKALHKTFELAEIARDVLGRRFWVISHSRVSEMRLQEWSAPVKFLTGFRCGAFLHASNLKGALWSQSEFIWTKAKAMLHS